MLWLWSKLCNDIAFNLVMKHIDRINQGNDSNICFTYNSDFTQPYYHPLRYHILLKNLHFDGRVQIQNSLY